MCGEGKNQERLIEGQLRVRKKPTDHRQGTLVRLVDAIQRLIDIQHEEAFIVYKQDVHLDMGHMNPKYEDEIEDIMRELLLFDVIEIGDLYLTCGGRVVLDKGCGEYFNETDKVLYTQKELTAGIPYEDFVDKLIKMKPSD